MTMPLHELSDKQLDQFERLIGDGRRKDADQLLDRIATGMGLPSAGETVEMDGLELSQKMAAEQSFYEFMKQAWTIVEPDVDFIPGWHIEAIAEHLESIVFAGPVKNLLVNIPPGCMKSYACAVFLTPWAWIHSPSLRFLYAAYEAGLSTRDSMRCRQILQSKWYRRRWGHRFRLIGDQNEKTKYENDKRGWRMSTSVGGRGTGEHPDVIVVDDPLKAKDADSKTERQAVIDWWDGTISSRGKVRGSRRVIVMQRLHQGDLSGHVLENDEESGRWCHLCLPMRYEAGRMPETELGWQDPRTKPGELLWPEAFPEERVAELEAELGSLRSAGQLQQRPVQIGGQLFKEEDFKIVPHAPAQLRRIRYWDKAGTDDDGAFSVGVRMGIDEEGLIYVEDVVRRQVSPFKRNQLMKTTASLDASTTANTVDIWVEQEPGSGGKESAMLTVRQLRAHPVYVDRVTGDKVSRAMPFSAQVEAGNVRLVQGPWNRAYIDELKIFPNGNYKDQVDASSGAYNKLAGEGTPALGIDDLLASGDPEHREEEHRPFSDEEVEELPEFLKNLITETRATAAERDEWEQEDRER